jgi:MraZ protein
MDAQGRLLMPQLLRESADLKGEVAVMGYLNYLEVRNMEAIKAEVQEPFTAEDEKTLDELGI